MKTMETKRLTIDLTKEEHFRLKVLASFEGVTMKSYLLSRALSNKSLKDETAYLVKSEKNKKRLNRALSAQNPDAVFASLKELKHALGIK